MNGKPHWVKEKPHPLTIIYGHKLWLWKGLIEEKDNATRMFGHKIIGWFCQKDDWSLVSELEILFLSVLYTNFERGS